MTSSPRTSILAGALLLVGAVVAVYFISRSIKTALASYKAPPHDVGRPRAAIEHRVGTIQPGQAEAAE